MYIILSKESLAMNHIYLFGFIYGSLLYVSVAQRTYQFYELLISKTKIGYFRANSFFCGKY